MRPWLAIPIAGVVAATIAGLLGARGGELISAALAGAAVVHALRAFAGDAPAALAGACAAALLAIVTVTELGAGRALPWLALAAASWTFAELSRPTATPYVALAPAIAAMVVEPACVALVAIAGARLVTARASRPVIEAALRAQLEDAVQLPLPRIGEAGSGKHAVPRTASAGESAKHGDFLHAGSRREPDARRRGLKAGRSSVEAAELPETSRREHARPRHARVDHDARHARVDRPAARRGLSPHWVIAVPIAGAALMVIAIVAGTARGGTLGSLAEAWYGPRLADASPASSMLSLGDALGPIAVVAAAAGLAVLARVHLASLAILACAIGALLVDLRAGMPGAFTVGLASLCAGAGIARLAGMIRIRSGQAIAAATFGLMLLVPPAWTVLVRFATDAP